MTPDFSRLRMGLVASLAWACTIGCSPTSQDLGNDDGRPQADGGATQDGAGPASDSGGGGTPPPPSDGSAPPTCDAGATCDAGCAPSCAGKACGASDGCGGSCTSTCDAGPAATRILFFGGGAAGSTGQTWSYDGTAWTQLSPAHAPSTRANHAMTAYQGRVLLFGGTDAANTNGLNDTWEWDGTDWTQKVAQAPREYLQVMASVGSSVVMYASYYGGQTWGWDGTSWTVKTEYPASPNGGITPYTAMSTFAGNVFLFGGIRGSYDTAEIWTWNGASWTSANPPGPPTRHMHAMAPFHGKMIVYGGQNISAAGQNTTTLGDTWEWDGTKWYRQVVSGPGARFTHMMAGLPSKLVLFGGLKPNGLSYVDVYDTWEWDGFAWTENKIAGPTVKGAMVSY